MQRMVSFTLVLLSLAALAAVGYDAWVLHFAPDRSSIPRNPAATVMHQPMTRPSHQIGTIIRANWFGSVPAKARPVVQAVVPKTRLSLKLHGMVGSETPNLARALVSVGNKWPKSIGVGETVEGTEAKIYRIEEDQILLERNGKIESLSLNRAELSAPLGGATSPDSQD